MTQNDIQGIGATRFAVGLSQVLRISPSAYQYAETIKIIAGGGTLEVVAIQFSGTSTLVSSSLAWGTGYPLGSNEVFNVGGAATFYLAATGATMTAAMILGYTSGVTLL